MLGVVKKISPVPLALLFAAGLLPVAHSMILARPFRTPQLSVLLTLLGVLTASAVVGSAGWVKSEPRRVRMALASAGALWVWLAVSTAFGEDPVRSLVGHEGQSTGLVFWTAVVAIFIAALRWRIEISKHLLPVLAISSGVLLVFTIFWVAGGSVVEEFLVPTSSEGVPLPGVGNSAFLAAVLGAGAIGALSHTERKRRWPWPVFAGSILLQVVTQARVPILLTSLICVYLIGRWIWPKGRVRAAVSASILVLSLISAQLLLVPALQPRPTVTGFEEPPAASEPGSPRGRFTIAGVGQGAGLRLAIWGIASEMLASRPLLGTGPSNFSYGFRANATPEDLRALGDPTREVQDAHSLMLELAATAGAPAALLVILLVVLLILERRSDRNPTLNGSMLGAAVLLLLFVHLFEPLSLVATPLLAMAAGASVPGGAASTPAAHRSRRLPAALPVAGALVVAISILGSDRLFAMGALEWDRARLSRALRLDPTCQPCLYSLGRVRGWDHKKLGQGDFQWAIMPFATATGRHPLDSQAHLQLGLGLLFLERPAESARALRRASSLDPWNPSINTALAAALIRAGDPALAIEPARRSVEILPTASGYSVLAAAAESAGEPDLASEARSEARRLDPRGLTTFNP